MPRFRLVSPLRASVFVSIATVLSPFSPAAGVAQEAPNAQYYRWVTPARTATHVQHRTFQSAAVGSPVSYHIYIPTIYDSAATQRFPVVYWLHGTGGGGPGLPLIAARLDSAIRAGTVPPMLVVFPNGLLMGMWLNWKSGRVPMETVVIRELIPHIDATFRTIASREGRLIEGFSMGGYGAARLAFKYPDLFSAVSLLAAGPLQRELTVATADRATPAQARMVLDTIYGGDQEYFKAQSPWQLADRNVDAVRRLRIRQVVGDSDNTLTNNRNFHDRLTQLRIAHDFILLPRVSHNARELFDALGERHLDFYRDAFAAVARPDRQNQETQGRPGGGPGDRVAARNYEATIRRTSFGIPHIVAADLGSLGFGEGYAQAEDHLCTIADQVIRGRGERAKYFGRGDGDRHLLSDVAAKAMSARESADSGPAAQPTETSDWLEGFAAGYNLYLERTGKDSVPGWCRGQDWVFPVTREDLRAAGRPPVFAAQMARARPPGAGGGDDGDRSLGGMASGNESLEVVRGASQGWALGRALTESGRGALLANPHYPWGGSNRFWEKHLTIPGELDVYGAAPIGTPGVGIGFNEKVAWTLTTSTATQFTIYRLRLVPGTPTRYHYGGEQRDMVPVEVAVDVRGETDPVRRTVWFTHFGPVISTPAFGWTPQIAYAVRHAAWRPTRGPSQILSMNRARSLADLKRAVANGMAFGLNTVAVSADGLAWYSSATGTPRLSRDAIAAWSERRKTDLAARTAWETSRIVLLDGSDPLFEWRDASETGGSASAAPDDVPQLERSDYVFNANNSYWLAHPEALLTRNYSPLHGEQGTELTLRVRSNLLHLTNASPYLAAGSDGKFGLREIQDAVLANRSLTADLLLPDLLERCAATPTAAVSGRSVDLSRACAVLGGWDRRFDLDSRGAVLFREWLGQYDNREFANVNPAAPRRNGLGELFAVPFDPGNPITTPRGLAPGNLALENLAKAVSLLEARGLALDVPLGELQYAPTKMPRRIPVHGGHGDREGVLNMQQAILGNFTTLEPLEVPPVVSGSRWLTEAGYPVLHGSSFVMALEYTAGGPRAMAILTYSQSGDPASPHFTDQTERFARKEWRPVLFRAADIARDVKREYTVRVPPF